MTLFRDTTGLAYFNTLAPLLSPRLSSLFCQRQDNDNCGAKPTACGLSSSLAVVSLVAGCYTAETTANGGTLYECDNDTGALLATCSTPEHLPWAGNGLLTSPLDLFRHFCTSVRLIHLRIVKTMTLSLFFFAIEGSYESYRLR